MPSTDRFTGPLAAAWPGLDAAKLAGILLPPERSLPVPTALERDVWADAHAPTLRVLRARAEADRSQPWPQPLAHQYARYFRDGDRDTYEQLLWARQRRFTRAAVLAAVTLDPAWLDEAIDGAMLLCEQSTWCWPAHDDTRTAHGAVVPTVTDPYLDLGAGHVAAELAWLDHLLGEQFDGYAPGVRARIRHEVDVRVLTPFERRRDWHWLGLDGNAHNWTAWIHGNVLVAALRLVEHPGRRARLVDLAVEGLDRYVASLPADGAIDEGYSYWWNGACRALEALDVLTHATDGVLGGVPGEALRATVAFPHRVHLGGPWYLNLADGWARPPSGDPWHALHRAARRVGDADAAAHAAAQRDPDGPLADEHLGLGRMLRALTDPDWATASGTSPLPRDVWFGSTEVLVARVADGDAAGLTLAVKGGHNGEHHNHNDVGSVVVALGGVPVLVDAGRPTYTARTFGPDRYGIWTMRSDWHNVPGIRGTTQAPGRRFAARDVAVIDDGAGLTLDLAAAYPLTDVGTWRRTARLDRARGCVVVTDVWELAPATVEEPTTLRWLIAGEVRLHEGRAEVTALEGAGRVALIWEPASAPGTVTVRVLDDPMLVDVWGDRLTRLEIDVTSIGAVGTLTLTVEVIHE
ncbi:heparinase II/III family protein [Luedemannella flava]